MVTAFPCSSGGARRNALTDSLTPFGMRFEVVSEEVGMAVAVKMCRSIVVKGLEALLFECVMGASKYGAEDRVFASLQESFPGMDWKKLADYVVGRVVVHGERRAREMEEVAETLALQRGRADYGGGNSPTSGLERPHGPQIPLRAGRARQLSGSP